MHLPADLQGRRKHMPPLPSTPEATRIRTRPLAPGWWKELVDVARTSSAYASTLAHAGWEEQPGYQFCVRQRGLECQRRGHALRRRGQAMSSTDSPPAACTDPGCSRQAAIIHAGLPYCGEHALAKLQAGELPDRLSDPPRTAVPELLRRPSQRASSSTTPAPISTGSHAEAPVAAL